MLQIGVPPQAAFMAIQAIKVCGRFLYIFGFNRSDRRNMFGRLDLLDGRRWTDLCATSNKARSDYDTKAMYLFYSAVDG